MDYLMNFKSNEAELEKRLCIAEQQAAQLAEHNNMLRAQLAAAQAWCTAITRAWPAAEAEYADAQENSQRDSLTNLLNRRGSSERLGAIARIVLDHNRVQSERNKPEAIISICFLNLDLDHFKTVNDTYGHAVGDRVLQVMADQAMAVFKRSSDVIGRESEATGKGEENVVARHGGEEFVIKFPCLQSKSLGTMRLVAEKLRKRVEKNCVIWSDGTVGASPLKEGSERLHGVTVSIGATYVTPLNSEEWELQLPKTRNRVDKALYAAKKSGRNCIKVFTEDGRDIDLLNDSARVAPEIPPVRGNRAQQEPPPAPAG